MPDFEISSPEGQRYRVTAPDGATEQDAISYVQSQLAADPNFGAKPRGLISGVQDIWDKPDGLSLIGMVKGLYEGAKLPGDIAQGNVQMLPPGLRREDFTDIPPVSEPGPNTTPGLFGPTPFAPVTPGPNDAVIGGAMSLASLPALSSAPAPVRGAPGTGFARPGQPGPALTNAPAAAETITPKLLDAAGRIDVPIPRFMVGSRMDQSLAAGLQNIPGAGDKIAQAANKTVEALGSAADRVKEGYGTGSPAVAGSYAKDALTEWLTGGSQKVASRVYDAVDNLVNPEIATPLAATAKAAQEILARRAASKIPGKSAAVDAVAEAIATPGMTYPDLKGLRSYIGELTPEELVSQGLRGSEVKYLYGALTKDLRNSVSNAGGEKALAAFEKANRIFENISTVRTDLAKVIGTKGDAAPEAVFSRLMAMAGSKSTANIDRLIQARKVMGGEAWNEVASAIVAKLGRDPQGDFSIQRFLRAYGDLSSEGRSTLFKTTGRDALGQSLDDINFVTKSIENKLKQFANPSGTARSLMSSQTVLDMLRNPIKVLSTVIGGTRLAKVLSEPATARAAADWAKAYHDAITAPHVGSSRKVREAADNLATRIVRQSGSGNQRALAAALQVQAGNVNPSNWQQSGPIGQ